MDYYIQENRTPQIIRPHEDKNGGRQDYAIMPTWERLALLHRYLLAANTQKEKFDISTGWGRKIQENLTECIEVDQDGEKGNDTLL